MNKHNKYNIELSPIMGNWGWVKRDGIETVAMGKIANITEVADVLNNETAPLLETIAAKDARIAELEAQLAELTKGANKAVSMLDYVTFHSSHAAQLVLKKAVAGDDFSNISLENASPHAPELVETFEPETLTGKFSSYWQLFIEPHGLVTVFNFHYDGGYEQVIVLPEDWEKYEKALEASIGKEITIKATWQDDELEFIFDSIVPVNLPPLPVICATCNSVIEGIVHTRHGLDDSYMLCGACVTENED